MIVLSGAVMWLLSPRGKEALIRKQDGRAPSRVVPATRRRRLAWDFHGQIGNYNCRTTNISEIILRHMPPVAILPVQSSQYTSCLNATRYIVPSAKVWQSSLDHASAVLHTYLKGSTAGLQMQLFGSISGRRLDRFLPRHLRRTSSASVIHSARSRS